MLTGTRTTSLRTVPVLYCWMCCRHWSERIQKHALLEFKPEQANELTMSNPSLRRCNCTWIPLFSRTFWIWIFEFVQFYYTFKNLAPHFGYLFIICSHSIVRGIRAVSVWSIQWSVALHYHRDDNPCCIRVLHHSLGLFIFGLAGSYQVRPSPVESLGSWLAFRVATWRSSVIGYWVMSHWSFVVLMQYCIIASHRVTTRATN